MNQISPRNRLLAPSLAYPFGTDNLGRDMLSRCLYGAQLSVIIGFTAATLATIVSVVIGILTGYLGGKIDLITQRFVDAWMSFPDLIILLVVVSVLGPGIPQIVGTLGLLLGIAGSRIIRSAVVSVRGDNGLVQWRAVSKDGAELPPIQATTRAASQQISVGETYDFEYVPTAPVELRIEVRVLGSDMLTTELVSVTK